MKKILNDPYSYVDEMPVGLCAAHPEFYRQTGDNGRMIARPDAPVRGKVGIVSGCGAGHPPVFTGYVGRGRAPGGGGRGGRRGALDALRDRPAQLGRARIFGDRSVGLDDPGMLAFKRMGEGLR